MAQSQTVDTDALEVVECVNKVTDDRVNASKVMIRDDEHGRFVFVRLEDTGTLGVTVSAGRLVNELPDDFDLGCITAKDDRDLSIQVRVG